MMTNELLRRYAVDGSESAFTELVRQHIDLVYSAALRQVNGDIGAAQDITQAVFTDLARKASQLAGHTSLTGWLYTSARFQAAKSRRAEQRRHTREEESHAMNQLLQTNDPGDAWLDMHPVLDDVMHELNDADREAVLLRFFERKPLAEIGARLGLSENAARMRVDRALEKLRTELSKRGITSTAAALALALTERAVGAAPASLFGEVSQSALAAVAARGGMASGLLRFVGPAALKWIGGAAVASFGVALLIRHVQTVKVTTSTEATAPTSSQLAAANVPSQTPLPAAASSVLAAPSLDTTNKLTLHIVTADSGKPVLDVDLDYWTWEGRNTHHHEPLHANRFGVCEVPVERSTVTKLILVSERAGFADTRLQWHPDQGEKIPQEYTLRLARATPIGGTVVDADGNPVSGAKIGFNNGTGPNKDPKGDLLNETSDFNWPFWIETTSDSTGHWQIDRIAKEAIHNLEGGAQHPEHVEDRLSVGNNPGAEKQLIAGSYVYHLGRAIEVYGDVTDPSGNPVSDASVSVGYIMSGRRESKTRRNGTFSVGGCKPAKTVLTAEATGLAAITIEVDLATNRGPFHLSLQPGKLLRLRAVDTNGNPIQNVAVSHDIIPQFFGNETPTVQANFDGKTDVDGRVKWDNAPNGELTFNFHADGNMSATVQVRPDGQEHVFTLSAPSSPLTLIGSVTDATTGQLIPSFRIIEGWPNTNSRTGEVGPQWSTLNRFWLKFEGGAFRHVFTEPPLGGEPNPGFMFKFEADGYSPHVTRPFSCNEGEVRLEVALRPAAPTSFTVLLPGGEPAAKADVGLVWHGTGLRLRPGEISRENTQSAESLFSTDDAGQVSLYIDETVKSIAVAHPQGFVQLSVAALSTNTTIQLQRWSRIEGTLLYDGLPAAGRVVFPDFDDGDSSSIASDSGKFKVTTDRAGHFIFPQVPPGENRLDLIVPIDRRPDHEVWSLQTLTNLDVPPGETVTVTATTTIPDDATITLPHPAEAAQPPRQ
jgi:RNA polymerase sigma factor (sigma-70 family)